MAMHFRRGVTCTRIREKTVFSSLLPLQLLIPAWINSCGQLPDSTKSHSAVRQRARSQVPGVVNQHFDLVRLAEVPRWQYNGSGHSLPNASTESSV